MVKDRLRGISVSGLKLFSEDYRDPEMGRGKRYVFSKRSCGGERRLKVSGGVMTMEGKRGKMRGEAFVGR